MLIQYSQIIFLTCSIFCVGLLGSLLVKKNLILLLLCIEIMLISVQLNNIITSYNFNDIIGQIFNLFILMIAAAEVAIGLAFLIINYRLRGTIETKFIYLSKG